MYSFSIAIQDLHDQYGKVFHFINHMRWKHRLYGFETMVWKEKMYLVTFYKKNDIYMEENNND